MQLDEIQIVDQSEEVKTKEDALEMAQEVIVMAINNVFARAEEKKKIESKRKTWNKIRKVEKINELLERRKTWQYKEPEVTVKQRLDDIFEKYGDTSNQGVT